MTDFMKQSWKMSNCQRSQILQLLIFLFPRTLIQITAADVHFLCMVEVADVYFTNSLAKYPKLQAVFDRVAADPVIAEWRKVRPVTDW